MSKVSTQWMSAQWVPRLLSAEGKDICVRLSTVLRPLALGQYAIPKPDYYDGQNMGELLRSRNETGIDGVED